MVRLVLCFVAIAALSTGCAHPFEDALGAEDPIAAKPVDYDMGSEEADASQELQDEPDADEASQDADSPASPR